MSIFLQMMLPFPDPVKNNDGQAPMRDGKKGVKRDGQWCERGRGHGTGHCQYP